MGFGLRNVRLGCCVLLAGPSPWLFGVGSLLFVLAPPFVAGEISALQEIHRQCSTERGERHQICGLLSDDAPELQALTVLADRLDQPAHDWTADAGPVCDLVDQLAPVFCHDGRGWAPLARLAR